MPRYGMVIDLSRCYGCRACMEACKVENNTPQAAFWMYVFRQEEGVYPNSQVSFLPRPCMHCDNAPCVKVCPVGAMYKREDGIVVTDHDRCIGCRYCEVACPYGVISFNWKDPRKVQYFDWSEPENAAMGAVVDGASPAYQNPDFDRGYQGGGESRPRAIAGSAREKGVVNKCTFCVHRVEQNRQPACVATCPAFALFFGDLDDSKSVVSRLLAKQRSFRLAEELDTRPRVNYIGAPAPSGEARQIEPVKAKV